MNIRSKNLKRIAILTLLAAFLGCNDEIGDGSISTTSDELIAGFTQTIDRTNGTVDFINISINAKSYVWDFGDGSTSIEVNPSKPFENGEYLVRLTATSADGMTASFEDSIAINVPDPILLPITFDDENVAYTDSIFGGAAFAIIENPSLTGTNAVASNVGQITNSGATFEGVFFDLGAAIDLTTEKTIRMNFWSDEAVDLLLKLENGTAFSEVSASHGGTGWESLDFDFSNSDEFTRITLFVDAFGTASGLYYIDDIEQVFKAVTEPLTAAPTPSRNEADVISLFSDVYTDVTVDTWRTPWSVADFEDVMIAGNATKKYSNLDFVGIETVASTVDISAMTHIHLDVWSPDITAFTVRLVDFGADGSFDGGDDAQADVADDMPTRGEWISYDIPLSQFTQLLTSSNMAQYIFVAEPTGNATIFVDNIYFYDENGSGGGGGGGGGGSTGAFPFDFEDGSAPFNTFEKPAATVTNIDNPQTTGNSSAKVLEFNKAAGSDWFAGMVYNGATSPAVIDLANGLTFKVKVWSPNAGVNFRFQIEAEVADQASIPTYNIDQTVGTANQWVELTYDFSTTAVDAADDYTKFVIFPDYDASDQTDVTVGVIYYIDDISQE